MMPWMGESKLVVGENDAALDEDRRAAYSCPICGDSRATRHFQVPFPNHSATGRRGFAPAESVDVSTWIISRCRGCTAEYARPRPTVRDITDFYATQLRPNEWEQTHFVEISEDEQKGWARFARKLTALRGSPGSMLEIGCAAGWLLKGARDEGWDIAGLEASPKFQRYATEVLDLPVHLDTIDALREEAYPAYDVVVMTDVMEHLQDPVRDLRAIRPHVKPGGYLVIATCDIGSVVARWYGLAWRQVVPSHTIYWTKRSMTEALHHADFAVERFSEPRYWDPDPSLERQALVREVVKVVARWMLQNTYVPIMRRLPALHPVPAILTHGRLNHDSLLDKIGDQAVLGDVMLVIARPI